MNYIERPYGEQEDNRRALVYSYRKRRLTARRMDAFVLRVLICASALLLAVLAVWGWASCL